MKPSLLVVMSLAMGMTAVAADRPTDSGGVSTNRPFFAVKRVVSLQTNSEARAFFTAPPPVQHFWNTEWDSGSCLQCHAKEFRIAKRHQPIRPVPHAEYTQCMQCHVRGNRKDVKPFAVSDFVGLGSPGKGQLAHPKAPPTIPHRVFMKDNCVACHGPTGGNPEIRTTHPFRTQCQQCHVEERVLAGGGK